MRIEIANKLVAVAFFILVLRMVNLLAVNLMVHNAVEVDQQNVSFIFQIFISGVAAFFLIFSPTRYKLYYFLPLAIFTFYGVLVLCSFLLGENGPMMFSLIYSINVMISRLMEFLNKLFLISGSKLIFLLINWIGIACYLFIVSFVSFKWFLSLLTKITLLLPPSNSKT